MAKKVIVLGGGVGGMSAAHELIERGYEVEVYDRNPTYVGGKARSIDYFGQGDTKYKAPLPGEHGFRFFPGFYTHIIDTMQRIPFNENGKRGNVCDNLVSISREMLARHGKQAPIITNATFPKNMSDIRLLIKDLHGVDSGLTHDDEEFFAERVWQIITSCSLRRNNDYERMGWWEYMEADTNNHSEVYKHLLVEGLLHTLVAAHAQTASTKTGGNIFLQLVFCMTTPGVNTDRVLDGPTNERWLTPWFEYLKSKGVKYHNGHEVVNINVKNKHVVSADIKRLDGTSITVTGDHFILGMPVERAALLMSKEVIAEDKTLASIKKLSKSVNWMNGIQFYLNVDVPICDGHIICIDSNWALTAFSQVQFWKGYDLTTKGNGDVKGLLSIDISEWFKEGNFNNKRADDCTLEEIKDEVWAQLKYSINTNGQELLKDEMLVDYYIDRDITLKTSLDPYGEENPTDKRLFVLPNGETDTDVIEENVEPLLVNNAGTWDLRPNADCSIKNLFFASDYVRTGTDLATMEGANEAARRATNCILEADGSSAPKCKIWPLKEPSVFKPLRWYDQRRYAQGLPWSMHIPGWLKAFMIPWSIGCMIVGFFSILFKKIF